MYFNFFPKKIIFFHDFRRRSWSHFSSIHLTMFQAHLNLQRNDFCWDLSVNVYHKFTTKIFLSSKCQRNARNLNFLFSSNETSQFSLNSIWIDAYLDFYSFNRRVKWLKSYSTWHPSHKNISYEKKLLLKFTQHWTSYKSWDVSTRFFVLLQISTREMIIVARL